MEHWIMETGEGQPVLTHICDAARPHDTQEILRQDIGGGYIRCERCQEKFLPQTEPGGTRLMLRLQFGTNADSSPVPMN
jgi:hypothetical protein